MNKDDKNSVEFAIRQNGEFISNDPIENENNEKLRDISMKYYGQSGPQWNDHSILFLKRQALSRILYLDNLYRQIVDVPGIICEFGVQWGASFSTLMNLRNIYEPYNYSRHLIGFDTFEGFPVLDDKDGGFTSVGDFAVSKNYEDVLASLLELHEQFAPDKNIKKFELVKGDVSETFPAWLDANPHAVISMAIFDMDIYAPTKVALEAVLPRLTRGSLLVFDELNCPFFPGETTAVNEVCKLKNLRLRRFPYQNPPYGTWAVYGE